MSRALKTYFKSGFLFLVIGVGVVIINISELIKLFLLKKKNIFFFLKFLKETELFLSFNLFKF